MIYSEIVCVYVTALPPSPADTDSGTDSGISEPESSNLDDKAKLFGLTDFYTSGENL